MAAFVNQVSETCDYINSHVRIAGATLTDEEMLDCCAYVQRNIANAMPSSIRESDATTCIGILSNSELRQDTKLLLARLIRSKVHAAQAVNQSQTLRAREPQQSTCGSTHIWERHIG